MKKLEIETVKIKYFDLWVTDLKDDIKPISWLENYCDFECEYQHIHGNLEIQINGKNLPSLGFFGENDVCFNTWLYELQKIINLNEEEIYIFDEGEQGSPAYKFERNKDILYISIIESKISENTADPDWQNIECNFNEMSYQVGVLMSNFKCLLKKEIPSYFEVWLQYNVYST